MTTSSRRGFTLVELLIVIAIIGMLMGLLLPAIQSARERARMTTCSNNQRNIATAIFNKTTNKKGEYPSWAEYMEFKVGTRTMERAMPWPVKLLPQLDNATLWEQVRSDNGGSGFTWDRPPALAVFMCPSDASTNPDLGTISYVINSGTPDTLNTTLAANEVSDVKANGIAHDLRRGRKGEKVRSTDIPDGAETTLLLTENVHRDLTTWLGPVQTPPSGNVDSLAPDMSDNPEQRFGFVWVYDEGTAPGQPPANMFAPINREADLQPSSYANEGSVYAHPASTHPEVVVVAFAGGSVSELAETIDYAVYQQLMTPAGLKAMDTTQRPPVLIEKPNRTFMTKPLNAGDY
jgi:prepilin-type N-terminal cleavage/methylation domain-containing protein